jgi:signal transduction histidine kinase/ActR/RegA family two-component response regulator
MHTTNTALAGASVHVEREHRLLAAQRTALELATTGASRDEVLHVLARAAQTQFAPIARAALFVVDADGTQLRLAATAGLDDEYRRAVDGLVIGPDAPGCGRAAYHAEMVVAGDVLHDPQWSPYHALAQAQDIAACWSYPIATASGRVLGTLAIYHRTPWEPSPEDLEPVSLIARTAALIIEWQRETEERKRAEEALRKQEAQLAGELEVVQALHDLGARISAAVDLSAAAQETLDALIALVGADTGTVQLYDQQAGGLVFIGHRGLDPALLAAIGVVKAGYHSTCAEALRTGRRVIVEDFETAPAAAAHRDTAAMLGYRAAQSTPLLSRAGEVVGVLTTHHRSPRRPSERELRLIDLYAHQAAHLLEQARGDAALREANQRKDEFLAMLAHELRNPLAPIRNAAQCLNLQSAPEAVLRQAREIIERQVRHMTRLVDDLLDVSRINLGRIELQRQEVDLAVAAGSALEACRPAVEHAGHTLHVDLPSESLAVSGDLVRLSQVFANLLNNAVKYTPAGGHIALVLRREGDEAVLRVTDDGIGIPHGMLERVFEMFTQVDASLERSHGGLGIGLTLARRLVQMHDGRITASSEGPGRGSTFEIRLPLVVPAHATQLGAAQEPRTAAAARRVLVADDNVDAAESLCMLLQIAGHEVRCAHDGVESVRVAEQFRPEVVLLDIGMPRLNGYGAARQIRALPEGPSMLLIALTGWGQDEDKRLALDAGFDRHLTKPVEPEALMALVQGPAGNASTTA